MAGGDQAVLDFAHARHVFRNVDGARDRFRVGEHAFQDHAAAARLDLHAADLSVAQGIGHFEGQREVVDQLVARGCGPRPGAPRRARGKVGGRPTLASM